MDYMEWFPQRVAELRSQKGVSARDMSLSLGQSESYINKIENKHTLPSMAGFFYICELRHHAGQILQYGFRFPVSVCLAAGGI